MPRGVSAGPSKREVAVNNLGIDGDLVRTVAQWMFETFERRRRPQIRRKWNNLLADDRREWATVAAVVLSRLRDAGVDLSGGNVDG